jgi:hypothetical protein
MMITIQIENDGIKREYCVHMQLLASRCHGLCKAMLELEDEKMIPTHFKIPDVDFTTISLLVEWLGYSGIELLTSREEHLSAPTAKTGQQSKVHGFSLGQAQALGTILRDEMGSPCGVVFKKPVAKLSPDIAVEYLEKVKHPMDLHTMQKKAFAGQYASIHDFEADLSLILENSKIYNGDRHYITYYARQVLNTIRIKVAGNEILNPQGFVTGSTPCAMANQQLIKLIVFADKYSITDLANHAMDTLVNFHRAKDEFLSEEDMNFVYKVTKPSSKLRLYAASTLLWALLQDGGGKISASGEDKLVELATDNVQLAQDVWELMEVPDAGNMDDPRRINRTLYHNQPEEVSQEEKSKNSSKQGTNLKGVLMNNGNNDKGKKPQGRGKEVHWE